MSKEWKPKHKVEIPKIPPSFITIPNKSDVNLLLQNGGFLGAFSEVDEFFEKFANDAQGKEFDPTTFTVQWLKSLGIGSQEKTELIEIVGSEFERVMRSLGADDKFVKEALDFAPRAARLLKQKATS